MASIKDQPAFPVQYELAADATDAWGDHFSSEYQTVVNRPGLSRREYIAIRAMQALIPVAEQMVQDDRFDDVYDEYGFVARCAVQYADALIAVLEKDAE